METRSAGALPAPPGRGDQRPAYEWRGFRSLQEQIDTTSAGGRFYLHILAAQAEFERELISERPRAGMESARRRGKHIGQPHKLTPDQLDQARAMIRSGADTRAEFAAMFGVNVATLRRAVKEAA